jgi:hypothetical protein
MYDKFYLLVWTCQQVYFDNLLVANYNSPLAKHIKCSDYFDKFSLLTHTDEQNLYFDNFFMTSALVQKLAC